MRPTIEYRFHVWGAAPKYTVNLFNIIQKCAYCIIEKPELTDSLLYLSRVKQGTFTYYIINFQEIANLLLPRLRSYLKERTTPSSVYLQEPQSIEISYHLQSSPNHTTLICFISNCHSRIMYTMIRLNLMTISVNVRVMQKVKQAKSCAFKGSIKRF